MTPQPSKVKLFSSMGEDEFELIVLNAIMHDVEVFTKFKGVLCVHPETKQFHKDFSRDIHNAVYQIIQQVYALVPSISRGTSADIGLYRIVVNATLARPDAQFLEAEIQDVLGLILQLKATYEPTSCHACAQEIPEWLSHMRTRHCLIDASYKRVADPKAHASDLALWTAPLSVVDGKDLSCQKVVADHFYTPEVEDEEKPMKTPFAALNEMLGGGFYRKECVGFVAPSGAGKTVVGCQMAAYWASQGFKGLYIMTEGTPRELIARMAACDLRIPYNTIVRKRKASTYSTEQLTRINNYIATIGEQLRFSEWREGDKTAVADIPMEIERARKELGRVDFLVFDWIGQGVQNKTNQDKANIRHHYIDAMNAIVARIFEYDMVGFVAIQATDEASKKKVIDGSCVGEARGMIKPVHVLLGLSALKKPGQEDVDREDVYETTQWLTMAKNRAGKSGMLRVKRRYDQQRLET
jgi:KaiC/GvpD/RAD55 family RecA-like ATPase